MTEPRSHAAETSLACPFVAFDDDRDGRADQPDHRHRCYAEIRPAPRATAHQERYCLTAAFGTCPTFLDWARRESARVRWPSRAAGAAAAGAATAGAAGAAGEPAVSSHTTTDPAERSGSGSVAGTRVEPTGLRSDQAATGGQSPVPPATASSAVPPAAAGLAASRFLPPEQPAAPTRDQRPWATPPPWAVGGGAPGPELDDDGAPSVPSVAEPVVVDLEPAEADSSRASRRNRRVASDTPSWAPPRRYEAFPSLRPRTSVRIGRPLIGLLILVGAAAALFLLPSLLLDGDGGGGGGAVIPSPSVRATPTPSPSPEPSPTPLTYVVKKGDTMTKIAKAHGVTLEALMAANKATVKDPDKVKVGQELIIPVAVEESVAPSSDAEAPPSNAGASPSA